MESRQTRIMNKAESVKNESLAYLNSHYSDTFKPETFVAADWAYSYDRMYFSSKKYNGQTFKVYRFTDKGVKFSDDYFKLQMNDDACKYFASMISEITDTPVVVKVDFGDRWRPDNLAPNASFEDYLATGGNMLFVYFFSNAEIPHDLQQRVAATFADKTAGYSISFINTDTDLQKLQSFVLNDILSSRDVKGKRKDYFIRSDGSVDESEERTIPVL